MFFLDALANLSDTCRWDAGDHSVKKMTRNFILLVVRSNESAKKFSLQYPLFGNVT